MYYFKAKTMQYGPNAKRLAGNHASNLSSSARDSTKTIVADTSSHVRQNSQARLNSKTARTNVGNWELGKTIGEGISGKVRIATNIETGETCVVKAIRRPKTKANHDTLNTDEANKLYRKELYMIREALIGTVLEHPNLVRLFSAILGDNHFYCFFEFVSGEDLVDYICRKRHLTETVSRSIFKQVLSAIGSHD
jgi:serine/threonine protein kinase